MHGPAFFILLRRVNLYVYTAGRPWRGNLLNAQQEIAIFTTKNSFSSPRKWPKASTTILGNQHLCYAMVPNIQTLLREIPLSSPAQS